MKWIAFIIVFLSVNYYSISQNIKNKNLAIPYYVIAVDGLILRDKPTVESNVIAILKFGAKIKITQNKSFGTDTIGRNITYNKNIKHEEPIIGDWIEVIHEKSKGYLFDAYITRELPFLDNGIHIDKLKLNKKYKLLFRRSCFNNFWSPLNTYWYGLYKKDNNFVLKNTKINYFVRWTDPKAQVNPLGIIPGGELVINSVDNKSLVLLIGSPKRLKEKTIQGKYKKEDNGVDNYKGFNKIIFSIDSIGRPVLILNHLKKRQILNFNQLKRNLSPTQVIWEGDLDNDYILDYIISFGFKNSETYLYLSSEANENEIVKPVAVFLDGFCD